MVLIGLFAAVFLLASASPAYAIPAVAIAALLPAALAASPFVVGALTFVANAVLSIALSFVSQALFKPAAASRGAPQSAFASDTLGRMFNVRQNAGPRPLVYGERRVAGTYALMRLTGTNKYLHTVILLAGHKSHAVVRVQVGEEEFDVATDLDGDGFVTTGRMAGMVRFKFHLGDANQVADQTLIEELGDPEIWGPDHRLRGVTYMYVRFEFGPRGPQAPLFSEGVPNCTGVLQGKDDVYDPVTDTTGYSTNPALCVANYLCDPMYGLGAEYATEINEDWLIASRNACNDVMTTLEGTESRYTVNAAFESSEQPQTILGRLLGTMHGEVPYINGQFAVIAGVWNAPTVVLTETDLRGSLDVGTITSQRDYFNGVRGTFANPAENWQQVGFPAMESATAIASYGSTKWKVIELPGTISASMAQRIAKIDLNASLLPITVVFQGKLSAYRAMSGGTVGLTYEPYGWSAKAFRVNRCKLTVEPGSGDSGPIIGIDLEMNETASTVFSWSALEEQVLAESPPTLLPDFRTVYAPTNLLAEEVVYTTFDGGGQKSRAELSWTASPDGFAQRYAVEYKLREDTDYIAVPPTTGTRYTLPDLGPGVYDFRVAALNHVGQPSDWLTGTLRVSGVGAPPANVQNLTVLPTGGLAQMRWTPPDDEALRASGGIEFRHKPVTSGATWATATPIGEIGVPALGFHILPLIGGTYLALYFKRLTGGVRQYSSTPATVYTAQVALQEFAAPLATPAEDPGFSGTKTQLEVSSSKLRIIAGKSIGQYDWATIDLGSVKRCRLTIGCLAAVTSRSDLVDNWADVDSRPSWDTVVSGHEGVVRHVVRWTNDDPAGSPTWSALQRVDSAEFSARAFRIQTELETLDETWNVEVSALGATIEELA